MWILITINTTKYLYLLRLSKYMYGLGLLIPARGYNKI